MSRTWSFYLICEYVLGESGNGVSVRGVCYNHYVTVYVMYIIFSNYYFDFIQIFFPIIILILFKFVSVNINYYYLLFYGFFNKTTQMLIITLSHSQYFVDFVNQKKSFFFPPPSQCRRSNQIATLMGKNIVRNSFYS
jgi:hypothetical protein